MRIVAKTMTYGVMHLVVTFFVSLFVTRNLHTALAISMLEPCVQIAFFSVHEYFWSKAHPGQVSPHKGCCGSAVDLNKVVAFLNPKSPAEL
jgi:uncharacterized membrane protein